MREKIRFSYMESTRFGSEYDGEYMAIIRNFPGIDAEMSCTELREMAVRLMMIADDIERKKRF